MQNTKTKFYGQQDGERILYSTKAHHIHHYLSLMWLYLASAIILFAGIIISSQLSGVAPTVLPVTILMAALLAILGTLALGSMEKKSISYITDRRIVRFHAHTPFATSMRSLTWDQAVKVKTFPSSFIFKIMKVGNVIAHAGSTIAAAEDGTSYNTVSDDDIALSHVYYYKDLGNYIEKIIYTFKNNPNEMVDIKPFILKPRGKRY